MLVALRCVTCSLLLLLTGSALPTFAASQPNVLCIIGQCGSQLGACEGDQECRAALDCVRDCHQDDAERRQACMIQCTEATTAKTYDGLTACMVERGCLTKTKGASCPRPGRGTSLAPLSLADLTGPWYVIRGLSRAYDCWSCQKMMFTQLDATSAHYDYAFVAASPRVSHYDCTAAPLADPASGQPVAGRFTIDYQAHGMAGRDDWYVLSHPTPDLALVYYCGASVTDDYRGAVVIARQPNTEISPAAAAAFDAALADAGLPTRLQLTDFCPVDQRSCPSEL